MQPLPATHPPPGDHRRGPAVRAPTPIAALTLPLRRDGQLEELKKPVEDQHMAMEGLRKELARVSVKS